MISHLLYRLELHDQAGNYPQRHSSCIFTDIWKENSDYHYVFLLYFLFYCSDCGVTLNLDFHGGCLALSEARRCDVMLGEALRRSSFADANHETV